MYEAWCARTCAVCCAVYAPASVMCVRVRLACRCCSHASILEQSIHQQQRVRHEGGAGQHPGERDRPRRRYSSREPDVSSIGGATAVNPCTGCNERVRPMTFRSDEFLRLLGEHARALARDDEDDDDGDDDGDDEVARGVRLATHRVAGTQQRSGKPVTLDRGSDRVRLADDGFVLDVLVRVLLSPSLSRCGLLSLYHFIDAFRAIRPRIVANFMRERERVRQ